MKTKFIIFTFILTLFNSCAQNKKEESFEGIMTYKVSYIPKTDNAKYNEYQKQKNGTTLKVYILKNGSFKKEYLTSGEKGFDFVTYNAETNMNFAKWRNMDTIFSSNCSKNSLNLKEEKEIEAEKVYGQKCEGFSIIGFEPNSGQKVTLKYFYPKNKEYLNPELYKDFKDGFYDRVVEKMKSPFYKMIMETEKYEIIFEVENIEKKTINKSKIEMPKGIPLKEM